MISYLLVAFTCGWCLYWLLYIATTGKKERRSSEGATCPCAEEGSGLCRCGPRSLLRRAAFVKKILSRPSKSSLSSSFTGQKSSSSPKNSMSLSTGDSTTNTCSTTTLRELAASTYNSSDLKEVSPPGGWGYVSPQNNVAMSSPLPALTRELEQLRKQQLVLSRELEANESLGSVIFDQLRVAGVSEAESEKITLHCDEVDKVTRLILSLTNRLRQTECELEVKSARGLKTTSSTANSSPGSCSSSDTLGERGLCLESAPSIRLPDNLEDYPDIQLLISKRSKLLGQLEEARSLRQAIDRRNELIGQRVLGKYFGSTPDAMGSSDVGGATCEEVTQFFKFIRLKSKLICESSDLKVRTEAIERKLHSARTASVS